MYYDQQLLGALVIPSSCAVLTLTDLAASNSISSIIVQTPKDCDTGFGLTAFDIDRSSYPTSGFDPTKKHVSEFLSLSRMNDEYIFRKVLKIRPRSLPSRELTSFLYRQRHQTSKSRSGAISFNVPRNLTLATWNYQYLRE